MANVILLLKVAGAYVPSPAWFAVIEQVPAEMTVNVVPLIEQAVDVVEKVTVYMLPAELVATRVCGADETVTPAGAVKVIVCGSKLGELEAVA